MNSQLSRSGNMSGEEGQVRFQVGTFGLKKGSDPSETSSIHVCCLTLQTED